MCVLPWVPENARFPVKKTCRPAADKAPRHTREKISGTRAMCVCSFCFYFADVYSCTMWSDLRAAVPQGSSVVQSLASSLPDVALASRAPSTSSKYSSYYNRWRSWTREHGLTLFPASQFHFAWYLRHLMTEAKTASPLESAVHSIAWFHQLGGEPSSSDHPLVSLVVTVVISHKESSLSVKRSVKS